MHYLDIETWDRKEHFIYFKDLDLPYFCITADIEMTDFHRIIKNNNFPFFLSFLFIVTSVANNIKELRYRIHGEKVCVHDAVHPSFTVLGRNNIFSYCPGIFREGFTDFLKENSELLENVKKNPSLKEDKKRDDVLYITSLPWVKFSSVSHPMRLDPCDSIPRIAWGKFFTENGKMKIPFSLQVHHALLDGFHAGQFFLNLEKLLNSPDDLENLFSK